MSLYTVKSLFIYLILSLVLSYLLKPVLILAQPIGLKQHTALLLIFFILGVLCFFGTLYISPILSSNFVQLKADMPSYIQGFQHLVQKIEIYLTELINIPIKLPLPHTSAEQITGWTQIIISNITQLTTMIIMVPIFTFFILIDGNKFILFLFKLLPNNLFEMFVNIQEQVNKHLTVFVQVRILEGFIVGIIVWIGLVALGTPYALFLAIFAAIANLIPYVGPIIGMLPPVIISFVKGYSGFYIGTQILVYSLAQLVDMVLLIPWLVARAVGLNSAIVIVSIIIGSQWGGVLGMIIAIPVANILKISLINFYLYRFNTNIS
ncbi:MAG: AI-2E family transporter [Bdellovibrionales bacterium]|nr:AI-2E family transporter [Bdellovibrionales bacterium]